MKQPLPFGLGQLWRYTREDGKTVTRMISGTSPKLVFFHESLRSESPAYGAISDSAVYRDEMVRWVQANRAQLI
jgi:hypothetical protein